VITPFKEASITIVGVGLIGGSLGLALRQLGIGRQVVGVSRKETIRAAVDVGAIHHGVAYEELASAVEESDLVFLCTPINRILELLPTVIASAPQGCVITDVGSTKAEIVDRAQSLRREGVTFIGGHPMAGSEKSGVTAADPFLFQNAIYVLTPGEGTSSGDTDRLAALVTALGGRPLVLEPAQHDRIAAAVSHLPQLMATALVNTVGRLDSDSDLALRMAAGGFRDLTRIASSPYAMWRDICQTNAGPVRDLIQTYIGALIDLSNQLDAPELEKHFEHANRTRAQIPGDAKGFLHSLQEVLLVVEDKPGVLASVTAALWEASINIDDIELLKIREGEGGTFLLGFDTKETAANAVAVLSKAGHQVRLR